MKKLLILTAIPLLFAACSHTEISSFEDCLKAGNPVMESYPRQCSADGKTFTETIETPDEEPVDNQNDQSIEEFSHDTVVSIKNQKWSEIAKIVHPEKGIRFSPYVNVNPANEQIFTKEELSTLDMEKERFWGIYDGSGEPINLSFTDYYKRFIYNVDFTTSSEITISDSKLPSFGNIIDNTFDIYPGATVAQYHMPPTEEGGLDWWSLRLVFEKEGEKWYLTGIIHDQWTI